MYMAWTCVRIYGSLSMPMSNYPERDSNQRPSRDRYDYPTQGVIIT